MKKRNRNIQKFLSMLLAMAMVMGLMSVPAFAAELDEAPETAVSEGYEPSDLDDAGAAEADDGTDADAPAEATEDAEPEEGDADADTEAEDAEEADADGTEDGETAEAGEETGTDGINGEEAGDAEAADPAADDGEWDISKTERPEASDTVTAEAGSDEDQAGSDKDWTVFYDADTDTYKVTFNIGADADGTQVVDLTKALEILGTYAGTAEEPVAPAAPAGGEVSEEDMVAYEAEKAEYDDYMAFVCRYYNMANSPSADSGKAEKILEEQGMDAFCDEMLEGLGWLGFDETDIALCKNVPQKPEPSVDKDSPEYQEYLAAYAEYEAALAEFKLRSEANVLQPGDVRKFELYLTSDSKHTYKYQSGSFTLATPGWDAEGDVTGFDGQILPDEYIDRHSYHVSVTAKPIQDLLISIGVDDPAHPNNKWNINGKGEVANSRDGDGNIVGYMGYWDAEIKKELAKYEGETLADQLNSYLLSYYGNEYDSVEALIANNPDAAAELSKTITNGNRWFNVGGEEFIVDTHNTTVLYDTFYKQLFSFAFGTDADIDEILGEATQMGDGRWEYDNDSWTKNNYQLALYYYMDHKDAWQQTDAMFQALLDAGLSTEQATWKSFMMALNIDGELTGNDWQNTKWPWYSSIKLDRVDFEFTLTKTDTEGNVITSSPAGFELWYVNAKGDEVYLAQKFNEDGTAYLDEDGKPVFYETTEKTSIETKDGTLEVLYAMTTDKVFYLKETKAPDGYEVDPTVYVIGGNGDGAYLQKMKDEATAGIQAQIDDLMTGEYMANKEAVKKLQAEVDAFMKADSVDGMDLVQYVADLSARIADLKAEGMNIQQLDEAIAGAADEFEAAKAALADAEAAVTAKHEAVVAEIDRLNGELDSVKSEFEALKAEYEASTDIEARNEMIDKMNALQAKAELLVDNMAAVKAAYDADEVHGAYENALIAAESKKGAHNAFVDALNGILDSDEYKSLQNRVNVVRELQDAKSKLDATKDADKIQALEKQLEIEAKRLFKDIKVLQADPDVDWVGTLKLDVILANQKAIEEGTYIVPELPTAADTVDVDHIEKPVVPDADDFEFDIPEPEPPKDPEPPTPPTPPDDPPEEPPEEPDIPDEPPPLSDVPPEEPPHEDPPPEVDIPEEEPPLSDVPEEDIPEEEEDIPDEDIPLSDVPKTGDDTNLGVYYVLVAVCAMGLCYIAVTGKKRDELQ